MGSGRFIDSYRVTKGKEVSANIVYRGGDTDQAWSIATVDRQLRFRSSFRHGLGCLSGFDVSVWRNTLGCNVGTLLGSLSRTVWIVDRLSTMMIR